MRYQLLCHAIRIKKKSNGMGFWLFHIFDPDVAKMITGYRSKKFSRQIALPFDRTSKGAPNDIALSDQKYNRHGHYH